MLRRLISMWRRDAARADRARAARLGRQDELALKDAMTARLRKEVGLPPIAKRHPEMVEF